MTTTVSQEAREAEVMQADIELTVDALRAWAEHVGSGYSCPAAAQTMLVAADHLEAFARHHQQAERGEAWRPIETAPKDWTDVLVFSPEHEGFNCGGVFSAFYDTDDACWFTHGPGHNIRLHPTHWQPLPTPPEAS